MKSIYIEKLNSQIELILFNVRAKLESEAAHNYIGYLWWILEPISLAVTYYLVFKIFLGSRKENFIEFLFIGIVVWRWFSSCISNGAGSIFANRNLYKQIYLPKTIFPWIECLFSTVKFTVVFLLILIVYAFMGFPVGNAHFFLLPLFFAQFLFGLGLAMILGSILPFFVDLKILISLFIRLAFYPSGIIFDLSRVPDRYGWIITFNPMAQSVEAFRNIIMYDAAPTTWSIAFLTCCGLVFYGIGLILIVKNDKKYALVSV